MSDPDYIWLEPVDHETDKTPRYEEMYTVLKEAKQTHGLSDNGIRALFRLHENGNQPITLRELGSPHSGWTNTLGHLHDETLFEKKYVLQRVSPTRRSYLRLSERGEEVAASLARKLTALHG